MHEHLAVAQALVRWPAGPGVDLVDAKNAAGRSPLGEAENAGWEEGARWFVEVMKLDEAAAKGESAADAEDEEEMREAVKRGDVEVEIEDAEGRVARMRLGQNEKGADLVEKT